MCGFVAMVRLGERPLPSARTLHAMTEAIAHRGPDGDGFWTSADVALGAVRLAVIDPDGGRQPVHGCRDVVAVYNGELYNQRELRATLAGHALADGCDTTLLPHLYEEHGDALVEELRGMFAFALWDASRKRLLLARDRLGIKPLFYAVTRDWLVAASECKAIFASGLVAPVVDRDALDDLFSLGYPCAPRTMFAGVRELPPGHTLAVDARRGAGTPRRYWRAPIPPRGAHRRGSARTLAGELREVLADAVRRHLVADAPVASALSGGLDSSTIAALAARESGTVPATYSIAFPGDAKHDESGWARTANDAIGARARPVRADRSAAALLPAMTHHLELPLLMPGALGAMLVAARQRDDGVKVVLTGDGSDELLGGYDVFRAAKARRWFDRLGLGGVAVRAGMALGGYPRGTADVVAGGRGCARGFGVVPPWMGQWRLLDVERAALLAPDGRRVRPIDEPPAGWPVRDDLGHLDPLDAEIAVELETRLPSWILPISDRAHMAYGVEARVPFLDDAVVEYALSLPPSMKMRGLREKAILRDAAAGLVPRAIRRRRKQPFMVPMAPWFFEPAPDFVEDALSPRAVADAGLFAPEVVSALRLQLAQAPRHHVDRLRRELVLMLVLGTQLLARSAKAVRPAAREAERRSGRR